MRVDSFFASRAARSVLLLAVLTAIVVDTSIFRDSQPHRLSFSIDRLSNETRQIRLPRGKVTKLLLHLRFRAAVLAYPNLFQTSSTEDGLRVELTQHTGIGTPGRLNIALGEVFYRTLDAAVLDNREYALAVEYSPGAFVMLLDGREVFRSEDARLLRRIAFDRIVFGTGWSERRPFAGELRDIAISADVVGVHWLEPALKVLSILLLAASVMLFYWKARPGDVAGPGVPMRGIIIVLGGVLISSVAVIAFDQQMPVTGRWLGLMMLVILCTGAGWAARTWPKRREEPHA